MLRTSSGSSAYTSGDTHIFVATHDQYVNPTKRPVIYCPGYNANAIRLLDYATEGSNDLLRQVGMCAPTLAIDAGGLSTWGNDTAIAAIDDAVTWFEAEKGVEGPYILVATSMGFLDLMAWARQNLSNVLCAVAGQGAPNLGIAVTNPIDMGDGTTSATRVNAAYGGTYSAVTHGPTHDPMLYGDELTFPILYFSASDDTFVPPSLATDFAAVAPDVNIIDIGAYGHGGTAHAEIADHILLRTFLNDYARYPAA